MRELTHHFGLAVEAEDLAHTTVGDDREELLVIGAPADVTHAVVELGGEVGLGAASEVHHHQAQFVALIAVTLHAFPGNHCTVVAEHGVLVVAHDTFADVAGLASLDIEDVNITVGRVGVVVASLFAAGVGDALAVGAVVVLLSAAPRTHGTFEGAVDDIDHLIHPGLAVLQRSVEYLGDFVHPVIPVAVHQILVDTAGGLVKAGIKFVEVLGTLHGDGADIDQRIAVGRHLEALEAALALSHLALLLSFKVHRQNLASAAEHDSILVVPHWAEL